MSTRENSELYPKVKRGRVSDQVAAQLQTLMKQGIFKPGEHLPSENDLAEKFSASRSTIREALRTLETMGIVEIKNGSGAFVTESPLSSRNLNENLKWLVERREMVLKILDVRYALQGLGARLCAENALADQIGQLRATLTEMELAKNNNDADRATDADTHFHYLIGEFSQNEILNDLIQHVEQTYRASSRALMDLRGRAMHSVQEHADVIESIEAHNGELAEIQMRAHLASVRADIANLDTDKD
jgi:GntR family transcriptional repressor for pyruvate dehydrogenase complex